MPPGASEVGPGFPPGHDLVRGLRLPPGHRLREVPGDRRRGLVRVGEGASGKSTRGWRKSPWWVCVMALVHFAWRLGLQLFAN